MDLAVALIPFISDPDKVYTSRTLIYVRIPWTSSITSSVVEEHEAETGSLEK